MPSEIVECSVDSVVPGPLLWVGARRVGVTDLLFDFIGVSSHLQPRLAYGNEANHILGLPHTTILVADISDGRWWFGLISQPNPFK
jgi:hypothetical protein